MYTEKSFHRQPRLEYHALSKKNIIFSCLKKSPLCSVSLDHCFYAGDSFTLTFLFIPNKVMIMSRTLGGPVVLRKIKTRPLW